MTDTTKDQPTTPPPSPELTRPRRGGSFVDGRPEQLETEAHPIPPRLPPNYRLDREHESSSYYFLWWTDPATGEEIQIEGPSKGKWQGMDAGIQAAHHHAETHASDEASPEVTDVA